MILIEYAAVLPKGSQRKHGWKGTRLYETWINMRQRCNNPNRPDYPYYGGRGISICDEWDDPVVFCEWAIENGYNIELTIDRIDSNGNYEPENCRWISLAEQQRNKSNNIWLEINGETLLISDASIKYDISATTISNRIEKGMKDMDLIEKHMPYGLKINEEYKTLYQIADIYNIPLSTLNNRWKSGVRDIRLTHKRVKRRSQYELQNTITK